MQPITFALVYVGTTLKDLSDVSHGWNEFSKSRMAFIALGFLVSVILMVSVTRVAKAALEKALAENDDVDDILTLPKLPVMSDPHGDIHKSLIIKIDQQP
nr:TVP38/TMEM64 family membrane protein slr0305-like [Ipomoea batatas]